MKDKIDILVEWAVWGNLDSKTDLELILLKGHLLLETILQVTLNRNGIKNCENFSFFRKIQLFKEIEFSDRKKSDFIALSLFDLNKMRNELAPNFHFEIENGELELWALTIRNNLKGKKFTKYTFRTKIVHSFSIISRNILELKQNYS